MQTGDEPYKVRNYPRIKEPFISEEEQRRMKREVRNDHAHRMSCAKARKKRKKRK